MDETAPPFSLQDPFYRAQFGKNLTKNILKDGQWGSYHHMPLEKIEHVPTTHAYVEPLVQGDLSTLKWIEGPINPLK